MSAVRCVQGHTAVIYDRGGQNRVDVLVDIATVRWERVRDNVSEATITLTGQSCDSQRTLINSLRSHRHEMVIYRGDRRVWEGPIHRVTSRKGFAEIVAHDVLAYLFATPLTQTWDNTLAGGGITTVTARIEQIINYELTHSRVQQVFNTTTSTWVDVTVPAWESLDPPINVLPYLQVQHFVNEAKTSAKTGPIEMTVGEHLANLARTAGIDYTTVGRSIYIWDVSRSLGRIQTLTEADFYSDIIVTEYGADHAQSAYVIGQDGVYGGALNLDNLDYYGPWTQVFTSYQEEGTVAPGQPELRSQAQRNLSGRSPAPIEVRVPDNSGIILTDILTIDHMVAGAQVPLLATLNDRKLSQRQKIDQVTVFEDSTGETVQVTLTPATKPDSDATDEDD